MTKDEVLKQLEIESKKLDNARRQMTEANKQVLLLNGYLQALVDLEKPQQDGDKVEACQAQK